mmetsp:Transcript_42106/g.86001  ORF Transcript_42106/g.86001 Transcript_42106/m.86001 type:complete len:1067 (-) Transcript_42106:67-3267(-)
MFRSEAAYAAAPQDDGGTGKDTKSGAKKLLSKRGQLLKPFLILLFIFIVATTLATFLMPSDEPFDTDEGKSAGHQAGKGLGNVEVIKSPADPRVYKYFVLDNGLQVMAVSDPTSDRAAAAMDVSVGHFSDPDDFPGLAHFLEHMLFMGSKKYPDENQYMSFLSQHGGSSNAYTSTESTNYHFDIVPKHFTEALDIFAQFFVEPLLGESSTEREVNAVHNEHMKNLQSDQWRGQMLMKTMANVGHPMHKFGTGNMQTLCNSSLTGTPSTHCHLTRKALLQFYTEHYAAPRMRLSLLSTDDLPTLEALVRRCFAGVPTRGKAEPPQWNEPVKPPNAGPRMIKYVPIRDSRAVSISWNLPPLFQYFKLKPTSILTHLIGHESKGSVASKLKKEGLIESLSASSDTSQRFMAAVEVSMSLTPLGLQQLDRVLSLLFHSIRMLKEQGPQEWVWQECADIARMHFRFKEKSSPSGYVVAIASNMQIYPPEYVISSGATYSKFDPQIISWVMNQLDPHSADIYVAAQSFASTADLTEPIYGTQYSLERISNESITRWWTGPIDPDLHMVKPNVFIPRDFTMLPPAADPAKEDPNTPPTKAVDRPGARLWYKQDIDFEGKNWKPKPKISMLFHIITPYAEDTPRSAILSMLFAMLYSDSLVETTYDASTAGSSWSLAPSGDAFSLTVTGYSDKLYNLLKHAVEPVVTCVREKRTCVWANPQRFEVMKDEMRRGFENSKKSAPHQRSSKRLGELMTKKAWSIDKLLYELSLTDVTLDAVAQHVQKLFAQVFIEGFVHGNADVGEARRFLDEVVMALGAAPLPEGDRELQEVVKLENGLVFAEAHTNPEDTNHAISLYYQSPFVGIKYDIMGALLGQMVGEPAFDQLRTKEQLGYIVACRPAPMSGTFPPSIPGLAVLIQSSFKDPKELDFSARRFLDGFVGNLSKTEGKVFEAHKASVLADILEKETSVGQQTIRFWGEIKKKRFDWQRRQHLVDALAPVTLQEVAEYAKELTKLQSHSLAVWIYGKGMEPPAELDALEGVQGRSRVHSVTAFKKAPPAYWPNQIPTPPPAPAAA